MRWRRREITTLAFANMYLGIDIGGTFTDLVLMDEGGNISTAKAPTTPGALEKGVFDAVAPSPPRKMHLPRLKFMPKRPSSTSNPWTRRHCISRSVPPTRTRTIFSFDLSI
jgi:hypothetical protein